MTENQLPSALAQEIAGLKEAAKSAEVAGFAGVGGVTVFLAGAVLRTADSVNLELLDKALVAAAAVTALALVDGGVQMWKVSRKRDRIRPLAVQAITEEGERYPEILASSKRIAELAATTQGFFENPNEPWLQAIGAIDQAHQAWIDSLASQAASNR